MKKGETGFKPVVPFLFFLDQLLNDISHNMHRDHEGKFDFQLDENYRLCV
jgi:hypothetical protein